ncbi:MAG: tRNA (adenosine(37)-N6)-dimethylallyltransferase MiaA [Candidatus Hydrogenedentes bacterium]|nr:tRNA (adenosine(37)-N6)-dimethylallyltransferase MiaA [Candidatus Hydrogenedentota bacterium]
MINRTQKALVVAGPTASGKTALGVELASLLNGEILSADSRQVYRGLDIGSGKDLAEYVYQGRAVPYHLIDIADLSMEFSVFHYQQAFYQAFEEVCRRDKLPVIVGGTGLYLEAALSKYQLVPVPENLELREELVHLDMGALAQRLRAAKPGLHDETDLVDRERTIRAIEIAEYKAASPPPPAPDIAPLLLVIMHSPDLLRGRIALRLHDRMEHGLIEEVEGLHRQGVSWERLEQLGLEYRFVAQYLQGTIRNRNDLFQKLNGAISQFAKRQRTWFRGMERRGFTVHWLPDADPASALQVIRKNDFK